MVSRQERNDGSLPARDFSKNVVYEAHLINPSREALNGRPIIEGVAIDPEGSPDADDAIYASLRNGVYAISVSIVDLASFIPLGSAVDREARNRFVTHYLGINPRNNIPMLPRILSENRFSLSSLWQDTKPTITTTTTLTPEGDIEDIKIEKTITKVAKSLSYKTADVILEQERGPVADMLRTARQAAAILSKKRGAASRIPESVPLRTAFEKRFRVPESMYATSRVVQEFMVLLNISLARLMREKGVPLIFRNHTPTKKDLVQERKHAEEMIEQAISTGQEIDEEKIWTTAYFDIESRGHKGLGFDEYARFSSPIRSYDNLVNQRILLSVLLGEALPFEASELQQIAALGNSIPKNRI